MFHKGKHNREKQLRFSIRKVSFGAASVAVAALFMFLGNGAVSAAEQGVPSTNGETLAPQPKDQNIQNGTYEGNTVANSPAATVETNTQPSTVENSPSPESAPQKVETLDKKELTDLIKEIDGKLSQGTYATKTEESVNNLRTVLEEARTTLNNAKTQAELSQAQAKLVTATTKLQTKPEEKKEAPAVDTTNGKATVGKKATNTEKSSESNSIANSGSKDKRNGKVLDTNNPFRTDTTPSTTDDTSANQVFDNPAEGADVKTLSNKLESLPETIQNNEKIQSMDELGKAKNVDKGKVVEIDEFGGWNAVAADGKPGKFAIARKTDKGVFPIETVNTVWNSGRKIYQTWVLEQSFDRTSDYMLFLSKVRTQANREEETFDGSNYVHTGEGGQIAKGVKGFNGIQKTFKAYSKEHGSKVVVSFKTGYTGDISGTKAKYKVEVIINRNGKEEKLYDQTFKPEEAQQNDEMTVVKANDGSNSPQFITTPDTPSPTKEDLEAKIANNKPNGTGGTFTSKEIEIPKGVTEYTVRISSADNQHLGMGYQSVHRHYALPLTGSNFSIKQDTKNVAKDLLQRIYNRLVEQKSEDTKWSTPETKGTYETKLTEINALLNSGINTTSNYKESAKSLIEKYNSLNNRDTIVAAAKADLAEAAKAEKAEIAADKSLTEAERKEKETAVDTKKAEEEAKITAAENADKVAEAKTAGVTAIKGVHTPGTSSSDGEGNVIVPPTVEVPAYTDPVGTSSTDGAGNLITPPTAEVPAYTDPVGTSSTDGAGNLITPPTAEVPAYTDPVGTSSTDGAGNLITPPTAEIPAYTDPVGTSSTDGAGNLITPPTVEVPAYTDPVGTSSTDGAGNLITPPTAEVPAYTGSVNGISEEMPAQPHKDGSANEMSDGTTVSETTINKDRQLPNTGTADSTVAMVAAAASVVLGLGLAGRRRKEDEEA